MPVKPQTYETSYDTMNRRNREAEELREKHRIRDSEKVGAPYYQPVPTDTPVERRLRSAAQRNYMNTNTTSSDPGRDEGMFADTVRTLKNIVAGKRGREAMAYGDEGLMAGARKAGQETVNAYRNNPTDSDFKKGGRVTASKRADGIAQRGKTRGRMV